ncbi:MAG TPA: FkbM family methyltransferase [Candidatus Dormibacteraeota bacterium]|nr:FkbM family methyltransferase [Candidatus Dormibacteraeota bacterium]
MSIQKTGETRFEKGAPARAARLSARAYRAGRSLADRLRLRDSSTGREVLAILNVLGQIAAGSVLFRGHGPIEVDGHRMQLAGKHAPSPALACAVLDGHYERATRALVERLLPPGGTFIDVGAHVGLYTLVAARRVGPGGRVYAFEPEPNNFQLLTQNIQRNGYANVTPVPCAVCERTGQSPLFVSRQGNDRHSLFRNPRSPIREQRQAVETTTLDDFLASAGWPEIDLVKMDIEGAEPLAIAGMSRMLGRSSRMHLIVEFSPEMLEAGGTPPCQFLTDLAAHGLELFSIEDNASLVPLCAGQFAAAAEQVRARGVINLLCHKKAPEDTREPPFRAACAGGLP